MRWKHVNWIRLLTKDWNDHYTQTPNLRSGEHLGVVHCESNFIECRRINYAATLGINNSPFGLSVRINSPSVISSIYPANN